jgi:hypothetical protein
MAGERTIKLAVGIDEQSVRKAKLLVDDLTRSVEKLINASKQAGVMGGGGVTNFKFGGGSGGVNAVGQRAQAVRGGIGPTSVIGNILGGDAASIRTLISASQQGFSQTSANIRTFVDRATADVQRLNRAVADLQKNMGGLQIPGGAPGGGGGGGAPPAPPGAPPTPPPGGGGGGWRKWVGGRVQNVAQNWLGLPGPAAQGIGNFATRFAGAAAVGGAVVSATEFGLRSFEDQRAAQIAFGLEEPGRRLERAGAVASIGRASYFAGKSGDISYIGAQRAVMRNKEFMASLGNVTLQREQIQLALGRGPSLKGVKNEVMQGIHNFAGKTTGELFQWLSGQELPGGADTRSKFELELQRAVMETSPQLAGRYKQAIASEQMRQNPELFSAATSMYQNSMGRVGALRSAGMSTSFVNARLIDGGRGMMPAYEAMESRLMKGGWSIADQAAGHQQFLGIGAGYEGRAGSAIGLISAGIGGLSNLGQLTRAGGILGGSVGAADAFRRQAMASVGRGGLDVSVGRDLLGGLSSRAMQLGQFGAGDTAASYMSGMAALVAGGSGAPLDVAQQQRRMGLVQQGVGALGRFTNGTGSPFDKASSLMGAMGAMGGYSGGAEGLQRMSPDVLMGIANGGEVPTWAAAQGITSDSAKRMLGFGARSPFFQVYDEQFKGTAAGKLLSQVRGAEANGGDFRDLLKGKSNKEQDRIRDTLGGVLFSSNLVGSPDEGSGMLLSMSSPGAGRLKGGGVGAARPGGGEAAALLDSARAIESAGQSLNKGAKAIADYFDARGERKGGVALVNSTAVAKDMTEAVGQVSAQLEVLAANIAKVNSRFGGAVKTK